MIDATNVLAGGQVMVQDPRSLLGKAVNDYIQNAMEHANMTGEKQPMLSPVHSLLSALTSNRQQLMLTDFEKAINGGLNQNFRTLYYNTVDLSSFEANVNPALGGMIKSSGSVELKSYLFKESVIAIAPQGQPAEFKKFEVLLQNNPNANIAEYFAKLHARGLMTISIEQLTKLLKSLVSKPVNVGLTLDGDDIYQVNASEGIFSKFNFDNKFGGGAGSNGNDMVVYADSTLSYGETGGTASLFPRDKVTALFNRMDGVLGTKTKREIFIICPRTVLQKIMNERRQEMNWSSSGLSQQEYLKIIVNGNSIVGQGTLQVDPHYNHSAMNDNQITYVSVPDWLWCKVFGKDPTKSFKDDTTDVYTLFALCYDSIQYESSELVMQTYVPAATVNSIPYGVADILAMKQKYASVVSDPYGIVAMEVLADNITLRDTEPNMNFAYSRI